MTAPSAVAFLPYPCAPDWGSWDPPTVVCAEWMRIELGYSSGYRYEEWPFLVIDEAHEWEDFWVAHTSIRQPSPPLPVVDFEREWVAVLLDTPHPNHGHHIEARGVVYRHHADVFVVEYELWPCIACSHAFSEPYDIIRVERFTADPVKAIFLGPPPVVVLW